MKTKQQKAQDRKRQRTIKKIYEIIKNKDAIFLTLSFNDATMKSTNAETRKRYIKNYLRNETALYIANIDYGAKNKREHYHAIIKASTLKYDYLERYYNDYSLINKYVNLDTYKYGNIKADFIGVAYGFKNDESIRKTATDLYNHSIKETTENNKLIYSRKEPNKTQQLKRLKRLIKIINLDAIKEKEQEKEQRFINAQLYEINKIFNY